MDTVSVLFAGVGGQGIVLASKILAKVAFDAGYMVKESELHGMAQRGGSVVSHVRFGKEVYSPLIPMGQADILVSLEELEGLRYINFLKKDGTVIFNENISIPSTVRPDTGLKYPENIIDTLKDMGCNLVSINAKEVAKELGNLKVENIVVLGMLSTRLSLPVEIWRDTISKSVPQKTLEINLSAFDRGREIGSRLN
ncbi:MAG: indolepyruvate oxidoreductase subunit beta [Thermodesulfovibrionales bacterium]|nr:indolepyruvate oxidoreductase subunit beta [Thermodesulfovibrionales bacterium]